jgi:predicted phage terminase large subunit-like protein
MNLADLISKLPEGERAGLLEMAQQYQDALTREKCSKSFLEFVKAMWPGFIHGRHHAVMAKKFEAIAEGKLKRVIINMPPRHAIVTSMKIPTTSGFKSMADLRVGDFVFGPDGKPTEILGKSEVFKGRDLYRVWTDDGAYLDVDGEHLWTVRLDRKYKKYLDYTTEQLWRRQQGEVLRTKRSGEVEFIKDKRAKNPRLPRLPDVLPVEYEEKPLLIDPYVLGVWLGDGNSSSGVITCHDDDAVYMRAEIERRYYKTTDQATKFTFGVLALQAQLKQLGLHKNKHIPREYLEASHDQRRDLLKGLMDTDGNVSKEGQCFFAQSDREFIDQVAELIRSMGIKANILESEAKIGDKSYGKTWKISFYANDVFNLPRKEKRTLKGERKFGRYIKIENLDKTGNTQCIKVDREDGLFLAGEGYICTHNTKSEFASYLLPAWFLGKYPGKKIIQCSNTAELAVGFGRKVRNLVDGETYAKIFPNVALRHDSKAAGRWSTNANGEYFAIGVGGTVTGKGADLLIIDDPHSEQEAALASNDPNIYDKVYEWYSSGPRQRLQPGGSIVVVMTRWGKRDLVGQVLKAEMQRGGEEWEVIEFPAILPSGKSLWPEFWSIDELEALRNELPNAKWQAQYQQNPTSDTSAIIKREWWNIWDEETPPPCDYTLMSWDTAFEKTNRADYSACTLWGVFEYPDDTGTPQSNLILLNAFRDRMEFPELKKRAIEEWKEWSPDSVIIEKKASGAPLIYELRAMGIPVQEYTPVRGNDKISRLNAVSDLFASGRVWAPGTRWADEVIDEVASFPSGEHDDYVDAVSLALMRFRKGGFIRTLLDEEDEPLSFHRKVSYY